MKTCKQNHLAIKMCSVHVPKNFTWIHLMKIFSQECNKNPYLKKGLAYSAT
jgi:hypothetical protein